MSDSDMARGTGVVPDMAGPNNRTRVECVGGVFSRLPLVGSAAMAGYEFGLRRAAKGCPRDWVFVAMIDSDGSCWVDRVLAPGQSLVFGRHAEAEIRHSSQDLSLRHMAVAVAPSSSEEQPLVRMWDLGTGRPFQMEDGQVTKALTADGPMFVTVGSVLIAVIPLASLPEELPKGTEALWQSLPPREVISQVYGGLEVDPLVPPPGLTFDEVTRVRRVRSLQQILHCSPDVMIATLTLSTSAGSREFSLSAEAMESGVLLGRSGRCLSIDGDISDVSRVHLLLSQVGSEFMAIDLASSSGTYDLEGKLIDSVILGETTEILLADSLRMRWQARTLPRG